VNRLSPKTFDPAQIAAAFVEARLRGKALDEFPGPIPQRLADSYACQDAAIALWPDRVVGWKVGLIPQELPSDPGVGRLAGPLFARQVLNAAPGEVVEFPVFDGGFAAVEAEYVLRLGHDAPAGKTEWTADEGRALVDTVHIGVETAGSPLAAINQLGPTVVVSDFGNNAGLILGPEIPGWRERSPDSFTCRTFVADQLAGEGGALALPGGPFEALKFLLELSARRGRPLKAGQLVSTGAATGIHDIAIGQTARAEFDGDGTIECRAVKAVGSETA
jgi:2-keto-4-pentenoate hydratase